MFDENSFRIHLVLAFSKENILTVSFSFSPVRQLFKEMEWMPFQASSLNSLLIHIFLCVEEDCLTKAVCDVKKKESSFHYISFVNDVRTKASASQRNTKHSAHANQNTFTIRPTLSVFFYKRFNT